MKRKFTLESKELFPQQSDKMMIRPFFQEDLDSHDHGFFEMVYITGGTTVQVLNGNKSVLEKGDFFVVDYGSVHSYSESRNLTLINCLFLPEMLDDTLKNCYSLEELLHRCLMRYCSLSFVQAPANRIFHDQDGEILELLVGMQKEYEKKKAGYQQILKSRLTEILICILREVISEKKQTKSSMVLELIDFVDENYTKQITLGMFCADQHYSLQYASRKFKQELGLTFREYLQKTRIEKSCELLAGSDIRVAEAAQAVGYSDIKFFTSLFKRLVGITPGEYRKIF